MTDILAGRQSDLRTFFGCGRGGLQLSLAENIFNILDLKPLPQQFVFSSLISTIRFLVFAAVLTTGVLGDSCWPYRLSHTALVFW